MPRNERLANPLRYPSVTATPADFSFARGGLCLATLVLIALGWAGSAGAAIQPDRDILLRWTEAAGQQWLDPKHVESLRQIGVNVVLLPWPGDKATVEFARACEAAKITPIAELAPLESEAAARKAAESAKEAGFSGVALEPGEAFQSEELLRDFAAAHRSLDVLVYLEPERIGWEITPAIAVLREGLWPGVRAPPNVKGRGMEVATASTEPWVDANSYLVAYLRGMFPERPGLLGYRPDESAGISGGRSVPFESLELALFEAFVAGGNYILSLEPDYHQALLAGDPKAKTAWASLGQTVQFLREHADKLRQPNRSRTAVAVSTLEQAEEVLNLMYRRNLFPVVMPANDLPPLDQDRSRALAAVNLPPPPDASIRTMLEYARSGGLLATAPAGDSAGQWWRAPDAEKVGSDKDRDHFRLGDGRLVAYHETIFDTSEFALDVIDLVGVQTRDLRLWNANSVVGLAAGDLAGPRAYLYLINYGDPIEQQFPARIEGDFQKATLLEPGQPPRRLQADKRGPRTEVAVDRLGRFALIELEETDESRRSWPSYTAAPEELEKSRTF